jgi:hypothetical protein
MIEGGWIESMRDKHTGDRLSNRNDQRDVAVTNGSAFTPRVAIMLIVLAGFGTWISLGSSWSGFGFLVDINPMAVPSYLGIFALLILGVLTFKLKRLAQLLHLDFSRAELFTIYAGTGLTFILGGIMFTFSIITSISRLPFEWYWDEELYAYVDNMSRLLFPWGQNEVTNILLGNSPVPWAVWIIPLLLWFLFFSAIFFLLFAIGSVLYPKWSEVEKIPFPLVTPVVRLVDSIEGASGTEYSLKNFIFLSGLAIPVIIRLFELFNKFFPAVPVIPLGFSIHPYFGGLLGQALSIQVGTSLQLDPSTIGVGYLVPTDLAFTVWFVNFVVKKLFLNSVLIGSLGFPADTNIAWLHNLSFVGGFMVFGLFLLWMDKTQLKKYVGLALNRNAVDTEDYPMHPRLVFWGSIVSILIIIVFGMKALGMQLWISVYYLLLMATLAISLARFRTVGGFPIAQMEPRAQEIMGQLFGNGIMRKQSWIGLQYISVWTVWAVPSVSGWVMEGLKMADESKMKRSSMIKALTFAILLVFLVSFPIALTGFYNIGLQKAGGWQLRSWIPEHVIMPWQPYQPLRLGVPFFIMGAVLTGICMVMHVRYVWWPFHPIGYLLGNDWNASWADRIASPFFIAWFIKFITLRWGGRNLYLKLQPFFIALIISDISMQVLNSAVLSIRVLLS